MSGVGRGCGLGGCPLLCGAELGQAQYPAFVPNIQLLFLALQKWQLGFGGGVFLFLLVQNFPQLHMHTIFSSILLLRVL